jgi:hypothetical protein
MGTITLALACRSARLSKEEAEMISLRDYYLLPYSIIVDRIGVNYATARQRYSRARRKLDEAMGPVHIQSQAEQELERVVRRLRAQVVTDPDAALSVGEEAEVLWDAMRRINCAPRTPQFSRSGPWQGEPLFLHGHPVTLGDVCRIVAWMRRDERRRFPRPKKVDSGHNPVTE